MRITLEFDGTGHEADVDLPAVPREGEHVMWSTDDAEGVRRSRLYHVVRVDWALSPDGPGHVQVRLSFLAYV